MNLETQSKIKTIYDNFNSASINVDEQISNSKTYWVCQTAFSEILSDSNDVLVLISSVAKLKRMSGMILYILECLSEFERVLIKSIKKEDNHVIVETENRVFDIVVVTEGKFKYNPQNTNSVCIIDDILDEELVSKYLEYIRQYGFYKLLYLYSSDNTTNIGFDINCDIHPRKCQKKLESETTEEKFKILQKRYLDSIRERDDIINEVLKFNSLIDEELKLDRGRE